MASSLNLLAITTARRYCYTVSNNTRPLLLGFRQRQSDIGRARRILRLATAASNDNKLPSFGFIDSRRGITGKRQSCFPKQLTSEFIENMKLPIKTVRRNQKQTV